MSTATSPASCRQSETRQTLDRSQGGLDIGLALVRRLIEMHGGAVSARSEGSGKGSEFVINLPLVERHAGNAQHPELSGGARVSLRILIVDDDVDAAESCATLLTMKGHAVQVAHDGMSALTLARSMQPHIVLLDIGLPDMDGYQVAMRLRELREVSNATLIALTGYGQAEDRRRSKEAGFAHHVVKPVDPETLMALLA